MKSEALILYKSFTEGQIDFGNSLALSKDTEGALESDFQIIRIFS